MWYYLIERKEMAGKSTESAAAGRERGKDLVFRHALF